MKRYYDVNYTELSNKKILVQYCDQNDGWPEAIKPTYRAIKADMNSAIKFIDKLNNTGVK